MEKKRRLLQFVFLLLALFLPLNVLAYSDKVIVGGETIGIEVHSKGVLIVDFYKINDKYIAKDAGFQVGDIITKVSGEEINGIEELTNMLEGRQGEITFTVERNGKEKYINFTLVEDENGILKTGLYIKDQINGVGTLSYIDPNSKIFGSLGHEIIEKSTIY